MKKPLNTFQYGLLALPVLYYSIKYGWRVARNKPNPLSGAPLVYLRYLRRMKDNPDSALCADGWLADREYKKQRQQRITELKQ